MEEESKTIVENVEVPTTVENVETTTQVESVVTNVEEPKVPEKRVYEFDSPEVRTESIKFFYK